MKNFRTFQLSVDFYRQCKTICLPYHLKEQLNRAASSVSLNLMEGRGRATAKDRVRFFNIAMGSVRECQAILTLTDQTETVAWRLLDSLAAHLFKLIRNIAG